MNVFFIFFRRVGPLLTLMILLFAARARAIVFVINDSRWLLLRLTFSTDVPEILHDGAHDAANLLLVADRPILLTRCRSLLLGVISLIARAVIETAQNSKDAESKSNGDSLDRLTRESRFILGMVPKQDASHHEHAVDDLEHLGRKE